MGDFMPRAVTITEEDAWEIQCALDMLNPSADTADDSIASRWRRMRVLGMSLEPPPRPPTEDWATEIGEVP